MDIQSLRNMLSGKPVSGLLETIASLFPEKTVFTTSFGIEDQIITHEIFSNNIPVRVVTLDTGRLFPETYKVFNETIKKYSTSIEVFFPDNTDVEKLLSEKGPFSFYYSKENRKECCRIRKVIPLNRALEGIDCWISGLRADQSDSRKMMDFIEYDDERRIFKLYPLFDWSFEKVRSFVRENNIPYNSLHDNGFVSIGCEPCTRAIKDGEDFRAGRWWWEHGSEKECGLHSR